VSVLSVLADEESCVISMETNQNKREVRTVLSEHESKQRLARYDIPIVREELVTSVEGALDAAHRISYPVVLKACGPGLDSAVTNAYKRIVGRAPKEIDGVLVQEMVQGKRELICGLTRDGQFGPCVMLGVGGIFVEAVRDVVFRVAPIETRDALDMMDELKGRALLGEFRGEKAVDKEVLSRILIGLSRMGVEEPGVSSVDINPLVIRDGMPIAVDALVVLCEEAE
jgi:succinyl-CoA synthetase beta subunit